MGDVLAAMGELLQYDRRAIADGELWRVVTGHAVHFGLEHFAWDAAVFALLALLCWRLDPRRLLLSLGGAMLAIPAVLWTLRPGLETYRGLSGLDSALYVTAAIALGQRLWTEGRRRLGIAAFASVAALAAKVAYELLTGQTLFVDAAALGFVPVPLAHAAGAVAGGVAAFGDGTRAFSLFGPRQVKSDPPRVPA
jgi:rhomboid family GlyGly-CTERM serine protease